MNSVKGYLKYKITFGAIGTVFWASTIVTVPVMWQSFQFALMYALFIGHSILTVALGWRALNKLNNTN
jgi:hypothetical protein